MTYQQTIIVGNLGGDPDLKYLPSGAAVCSFSVAVNEQWHDKQTNERQSKTTWYRVSAWNQLAETVNQYVRKGSLVMVIGTVEARGYTNNAGEAAASLELRARDVRFLGGGQEQRTGEGEDYGNIPF